MKTKLKPLDKEVHDSFLVFFFPIVKIIVLGGWVFLFVVVTSIARSFFTGELR